MQTWKTLARETVYQPQDGRFLTVEQHRVELPDGRQIDEWPWVITPDFVNVVAVTASGDFLCFRQTKYALNRVALAVVGGYMDEGEAALAAAQRELLEETGHVADAWKPLGSYVVDANRGCGHAHLFLAAGARWQQPINADDLEEQELLKLSRDDVKRALRENQFPVLSHSTALALALLEMENA